MSVSILEALQNAEYNLINNKHVPISFQIGKEQLHNAIVLLEKGYSPEDQVEELLAGHESVEDVPEKAA